MTLISPWRLQIDIPTMIQKIEQQKQKELGCKTFPDLSISGIVPHFTLFFGFDIGDPL